MVTDYERAVETLWKDVKDLRADLRVVVDKLRDRTRERVDDAREKVKEVKESAEDHADRIRHAAGAAATAGKRAFRQVRNTIEERPVTSVLAAIGLGMLIGTVAHWRYSR